MSIVSKHVVAHTANHKEVYACLTQGPLSLQIARSPRLLQLVAEVISGQHLVGSEIALEHDLGRDIGYSQILQTTENDAIFYAKIARTSHYTRFVKFRKNDQTSVLSLRMNTDEDGNYELTDVWVGSMYPPLPGESNATPDSVTYWKSHAFVFNGQSVLSSGITKDWPY